MNVDRSDVDRELQQALDVDPSPEFLARVRTRIASEPAPSGWRAWWMLAVGAAAAAAVIAVAVLISRQTIAPAPTESVASKSEPATSEPVTSEPAKPTAPTQATTNRDAAAVDGRASRDQDPHQAEPRARASQEPRVVARAPRDVAPGDSSSEPARAAVLLDAREVAMLRRLIAGVGAGRIDLKPVMAPGPFSIAETAPLEDILIAPLSIEPLEPSGEGARQ